MTLAIETEITPLRVDQYGTIRVGNSRVTLDLVVDAFNSGASPQQIVRMYSALDLADTYLAIGYYLRHKTEIDEYIRQGEEKADEIGTELKARFEQSNLRGTLEQRQANKEKN